MPVNSDHQPFQGLYRRKRVLVTGHTGFKGSWLSAWLLDLGAEVAGFSIDVPTTPSNFTALDLTRKMKDYRGDVRCYDGLAAAVEEFQPEIVFHLAAQPLVRESYLNPVNTFMTNAIGTMNVLECIRQHDFIRAGVIVTSDKCYRNQEWTWGYRETDTLGGDDPYSGSKACAELIVHSYCHSFFNKTGAPRLATARAGNVIGGGDWAKDRIVPDCARAWMSGDEVVLRKPEATRPWQHVLEPLSGYLWLAAQLWQGDDRVAGESFNFGPNAKLNCTVEDLVGALGERWPGAKWRVNRDDSSMTEAGLLKLCCDKALDYLGWHAVLDIKTTVRLTSDCYRRFATGNADMYALTMKQIHVYIQLASDQELLWAK